MVFRLKIFLSFTLWESACLLGEEFVSDVGAGVLAKRRVVPEDVIALSVFPFACFGWFVL